MNVNPIASTGQPVKQTLLYPTPEDEVYHDDALVYNISGPLHWQVNRFTMKTCPCKKMGLVSEGLWPALGPSVVCFNGLQQGTPLLNHYYTILCIPTLSFGHF
jgi:hypothetical protein